MNQNDLKPVSALALKLGVKQLNFGPPGSGKTPIINTAPRPVMLVTEPGLLSMRGSNVPAFEAYTSARIDEFFKWFFGSAETKNFDTLCVDSVSQMAETYIEDAKKHNKHGLKAYGEMSESVMNHLFKLYFMPNKHIYLICKQQVSIENGVAIKRPYFPGKDLPVRIPHLYDLITHTDLVTIPNVGIVKAFRCRAAFDVMARDRSGRLEEFEPPELSPLFAKAMQ